MKDKLITGTAMEGQIRFIAAQTTNLVNEASHIHFCSPTAAAALGRMLTGGALMGAMLKNDKDVLTLKINGGGPAGTVLVTAYADGRVKGYIDNPGVELPTNSRGKLDVGGAIGIDGNITVIKDMGLRDPYVGQVPIASGEIGDDLTYYYAMSEQTPSAVGLGVLVNEDHTIAASGGFIVQMMPGASELAADLLTYRIEEMASVTEQMSAGKDIEQIMADLLMDMDCKVMQTTSPYYGCDCSREKVEKAFMSIGKADLTSIYEEGKTEELRCHFCNKAYDFTTEDIKSILDKA